jgi:hypothetical protein
MSQVFREKKKPKLLDFEKNCDLVKSQQLGKEQKVAEIL